MLFYLERLSSALVNCSQLKYIFKAIATYDLLLCYLWLESIVKRIILNTKFKGMVRSFSTKK